MNIEWDPGKAEANLTAHGVTLPRPRRSWKMTSRYRAKTLMPLMSNVSSLCMSGLGNLLVVVYTYRNPNVVRVISVWKANKRQRLNYEKSRC